MKKILFLIFAVLFLSGVLQAQSKIDISLKNNTKAEQQTKEQLERLLQTYDLSEWIFTQKIQIDEKEIPHSHPILTLSARHIKDDDLLLSTFVHEQFHWFLTQHENETENAIKELKVLFPKVPTTGPEGGNDEESTYLHLIVNYFEYRAMRGIVGELRAKQTMEFWATDHYTWIYKTVLERPREIGTIAFKNKLIPPALKKIA